MFGIITDNFITKVHQAFDELEYCQESDVDYDDFCSKAVYTMCHAKDLEDAINAARMYQFCVQNWEKIEKIFSLHLDRWNAIPFEGPSLISTVSDEEAAGTYFFTNGLTKDYKKLFMSSVAFDSELYELECRHGKFYIGDLYLKYSAMSSVKMKLFDKNDNLLCNIVLSEKLGIFLEKNNTNVEVILDDNDTITIIPKDYYETIKNTSTYVTDKIIGEIFWDILGKDSSLGVAELVLYGNVNDETFNIMQALAASTFLLFRSYMAGKNSLNLALMSNMWKR